MKGGPSGDFGNKKSEKLWKDKYVGKGDLSRVNIFLFVSIKIT